MITLLFVNRFRKSILLERLKEIFHNPSFVVGLFCAKKMLFKHISFDEYFFMR